jgi:hypothetical protein
LGYAIYLGGISVLQAAICLLVLLAEVGFICAIGLGWSAICSRTIMAAVLTYLSILTLAGLSFVAFMVASEFTSSPTEIRTWGIPRDKQAEYEAQLENWALTHVGSNDRAPAPPFDQCDWDKERTYEIEVAHTEDVWWVLLVNPFVIVADASPLPADARDDLETYLYYNYDAQAQISSFVRSARMGESGVRDFCARNFGTTWYGLASGDPGSLMMSSNLDGTMTVTLERYDDLGNLISDTWMTEAAEFSTPPGVSQEVDAHTPVWPWGLVVNLLVGVFFFRAAVVRLKVPYRKLAKGVRVA